MTPKEKAKKLVDAFYQTTPYETWIDQSLGQFIGTYTAWGQAKQCALIAVDELIESCYSSGINYSYNFWKEVKDEILKL